jgi:hypothetical protein
LLFRENAADIVRDRRDTNPHGWNTFASTLKDLNIPMEFIGNTRRKAYIRDNIYNVSRPVDVTPSTTSEHRTPLSANRLKAKTSTFTPVKKWTPYSFRK